MRFSLATIQFLSRENPQTSQASVDTIRRARSILEKILTWDDPTFKKFKEGFLELKDADLEAAKLKIIEECKENGLNFAEHVKIEIWEDMAGIFVSDIFHRNCKGNLDDQINQQKLLEIQINPDLATAPTPLGNPFTQPGSEPVP